MSIGSFFHSIGHGIHVALVAIFGQNALDKVEADIKKVLSDDIRPIFIDAITLVSSLQIPGVDKRKQAFATIVADLAKAGKSLETSVINLGIELVVGLLKAKGGAVI